MRFILLIGLSANFLLADDIQVSMRIIDEKGQPVEKAKVNIYLAFPKAQEKVSRDIQTNFRGLVSDLVRTEAGFHVFIKKEGYYDSELLDQPGDKNYFREIVLPKKINPTALYAKFYPGWKDEGLKFPRFDEWFNYDLKIGDWLPPEGKGETADIRMKFNREFKGEWFIGEQKYQEYRQLPEYIQKSEEEMREIWGVWNMRIEIQAADKKGGISKMIPFLSYSQLKMPHEAPEFGYQKSCILTETDNNQEKGLFIRSRVVTDNNGRIVSAHYSKITGVPFTIIHAGAWGFIHYFNPTPNDRNLEFDPKKNLYQPTPKDPSYSFQPYQLPP